MAKDAKPEAEKEEAARPKKSKKLMIVVAVAVVLFLGMAGAAAFFVVKNQSQGDDGEAAVENAQSEKKKSGKVAAPVYVALEAFTVNLVPENGDQFLQLTMVVEVSDANVGDRLRAYTPKLRNNVMLLLSGKKASDLIMREGKETLANEVRDLINDVVAAGGKGESDQLPAKEVLFTAFIIQ